MNRVSRSLLLGAGVLFFAGCVAPRLHPDAAPYADMPPVAAPVSAPVQPAATPKAAPLEPVKAVAPAVAPVKTEPVVPKYNLLVKEFQLSAENKFTQPRAGWVRFAAAKKLPRKFKVLNAEGVNVIEKIQRFENREVVLYLAAGEYTVSGADADEITVLAIPETYFYAPGVCNTPVLDGDYDWAYLKPFMLSSLTTTSVGHMDWAGLQEFRSYGRIVLDNLSIPDGNHPGPNFAKVADETLKKYDCFASNQFYDGVSFDEYGITGDQKGIIEHSKLLKKIENPKNMLVYTWIYGSGKPGNTPERREFLKTATADPLHRLMLEVYCPSLPDEAAAKKYLDERLTVMMQDLNKIQPGFGHNFGIVVGSFNQIPEISIDAYAHVDFRYYLDMQLNLIANHPAFQNISLVGYWGCNYVDEDLQRWGMALLRHYFFEGKKEMLSEKYGFHYILPYLSNPEFAFQLSGWEAKPAEAGAIFAADCSEERVAQDSMGLWCTPKAAGNRCAVMRKSAAGANELSQEMTKLVPGKSYMLQYETYDYYEATHGRRRPRPTMITAELDGAKVTWEAIHTDRNVTRSGGAGRITIHRLHFTPKRDTVKLTFTDKNSTGCPGEELAVTFVKVLPRFVPEEE